MASSYEAKVRENFQGQHALKLPHIRHICINGLPDNTHRVVIWPMMLGITPEQYKLDCEILQQQTLLQDQVNARCARYRTEMSSYIQKRKIIGKRLQQKMYQVTGTQSCPNDSIQEESKSILSQSNINSTNVDLEKNERGMEVNPYQEFEIRSNHNLSSISPTSLSQSPLSNQSSQHDTIDEAEMIEIEPYNQEDRSKEKNNNTNAEHDTIDQNIDNESPPPLQQHLLPLFKVSNIASSPVELHSDSIDLDAPSNDEFIDKLVMVQMPAPPALPTEFWDQIMHDVKRSMWTFVRDPEQRKVYRIQLQRIIIAVICTTQSMHDQPLHYYQGYHDIAAVILLVCGEKLAFSILKRLSATYFQDAMEPTIDKISTQLRMLWLLLKGIDAKLYSFISESKVESYVTLSWILTWLSHNISDLDTVAMLFDLFIASHPLMPLYFSATLIQHMTKCGLYQCAKESSEVHHFISKFPTRPNIPYKALVRQAISLFVKYPPYKVILTSENRRSLGQSVLYQYPFSWVPKDEYLVDHFKQSTVPLGIAAAAVIVALSTYMYVKYK